MPGSLEIIVGSLGKCAQLSAISENTLLAEVSELSRCCVATAVPVAATMMQRL